MSKKYMECLKTHTRTHSAVFFGTTNVRRKSDQDEATTFIVIFYRL